MLNPSYLIKSRHDIYYFRYPLPIKAQSNSNRVSVSLRTRCPREALRLAKALEYHTLKLVKGLDLDTMNHADIMTLFKTHYASVLEGAKKGIDENGALPLQNARNVNNQIEMLEELINNECDDIGELYGLIEEPEEKAIHKELVPIMEQQGVNFAIDSKEYGLMKSAYKYALRNYYCDLLRYSSRATDYSLLESADINSSNNSDHKLSEVINTFLEEKELSAKNKKTLAEIKGCLAYLTDFLGKDFSINKIDYSEVRDIKQALVETPSRRNRIKLTRGLSLQEQIVVAKERKLEQLSRTSVNKYLDYFKGLFEWARRHRIVKENVFDGVRLKNKKKKTRRNLFQKDEVSLIIQELQENNSGKVKNKSQYWGTLIAIYTGARRNEIAGLLVEDVKQDDETGVWYFDITDQEEEGKDLKTEAAKRIVPVHSALIELGFLDFLEEAKEVVENKPKMNGKQTRLLYDLTYTENDKWGRKLGQFVNDRLLEYLGLRENNHKTLHSLASQADAVKTGFIVYEIQAALEAAKAFRIEEKYHNDFAAATLTRGGIPINEAKGMVDATVANNYLSEFTEDTINGVEGYKAFIMRGNFLREHAEETLARLQAMP